MIDGDLTDEAWTQATPVSEFTQRDPDEGKPATEKTEIRFLYDDSALYVAARLFDSAPSQIARRLAKRDEAADADRISIFLDAMHDRLTGAIFRVSAANVQQDSILYNDSWSDSSWDAVWQSQVRVDEGGWSAELRIPLSQLRFTGGATQTWGLNVERYIRRKNESSWLQMVPKNQSGIASKMVDLTGLDGLAPARTLELLPYTAARSEFIAPAAGNPFNDGARMFASAGLDLKWGVTSNLTLNGTVNPDFGQVEVDPAVVNLTAFETFFPEKRSFFLEGSQIFTNFGVSGANDFWGFNNSDPDIFYSRRIGRSPHIGASGDFIDSPSATTILGATKLTGKTANGWSVGLLNAVTDGEMARTSTGLTRAQELVEPLSNYFVGRLQRGIGSRALIGMMTTAVNRRLDTSTMKNELASSANVFGVDGHMFLDAKKVWVVTGKISGSHLKGSPAAIEELQRAPQRYFQRPDAPQARLDTGRTSLTGFSGRMNLNRNSGIWRVNAALWGASPGYDSNDLGFNSLSDRAGMHAVVLLLDNKTRRLTRAANVWLAKWYTWNFNRELQGDGWNTNTFMTFRNYWTLGGGARFSRQVSDDRLTRGGPSMTNPAGWGGSINTGTDGRKWLALFANANYNRNEVGGRNRNLNLTVNLKPSPMVTLSVGPQWSHNINVAQYVTTIDDPAAAETSGHRYVFGRLAQTQVSMTTRVNVVLTPSVSLQVYAQPLIAGGEYSDLKQLARPRTFDFLRFGNPALPLSFNDTDNDYVVSPTDAASFSFDDPDFSVRSLRVNAVFRWEVKPGSTIYGVWTRSQSDSDNPGRFSVGRDGGRMFRAPGDDVFLVKLAYWIGR